MINSSLIQTLDIDKLHPDDTLERCAAQGRQLSVSVFDNSASMYRYERRTNGGRVGVGQTERRFFGADFSSKENDAIRMGDDVRHFLDQEDGGFPGIILKEMLSLIYVDDVKMDKSIFPSLIVINDHSTLSVDKLNYWNHT